MTKTIMILTALVALPCAGCKIEPYTGMPVWEDPSTTGTGISAVPPHFPGPLVSDYPKTVPLCALDPETGKSRTWSSWFRSQMNMTEAKVTHAMEQQGAR